MRIFLLLLLVPCLVMGQIKGYVTDAESGEALAGVWVGGVASSVKVLTNKYGFFSLNALKSDTLEFVISGYDLQKLWLAPTKDTIIIIKLMPEKRTLKEVHVNVRGVYDELQPGKIKLTRNQLTKLPLLLGEKDPIRAFQLLPGVQEIGEGSTSLSVRGGGKDQNLILLDESTVYNANHLFGFFSTFNSDPVQQAEMYKGAFPAQYGGRLSGVIDVKMKEGNNEKFELSGGVGLIASRLMIQGPVKKQKASFLIAGRRTYADWILKPFMSEREKTLYNFGDLNAKVNFRLNNRNRLYASYYSGTDHFYQRNRIPRTNGYLLDNTDLSWSNSTFALRWNTIVSPKLFQNTSLIFSHYFMDYREETRQDYLTPPRHHLTELVSDLRDVNIKLDYDYFRSPHLSIKWGGIHTFHRLSPRKFSYSASVAAGSNFSNETPVAFNNEGALYVNFIGKKGKLFYENGLRVSYYFPMGIVRPEPRIMFGFKSSDNIILTGSYSRMNQYLHLVSNTGNGLPTDIWIPAGKTLRPAGSDIAALSVSREVLKNWNVSFEAYYKWIQRSNEYKSGVSFLGIGQGNQVKPFVWEEVLTQGKSWNYGYEVSIEKSKGKFTGFGGYTLSWSVSKFNDLNSGNPFYNRQDRRHVFEFSGSYALTSRLRISSNFIFATGNALSVPQGIFFRENYGTNYLEVYPAYNAFRAENYHRLDAGVILDTKKGAWEFSVYNVYNRKNPYSYEMRTEVNPSSRRIETSLSRQWLLPVLPSITYNFSLK